MNSPKRPQPPADVQAPLAGVTSVPAPKRDGEHGAVINPGHSMSERPLTVTNGPIPPSVTEPKRLKGVRMLAGVPLKTPGRKGPPPGSHMPHASRAGRIGKSRSPWRTDCKGYANPERARAARDGK